MAKTIYIPCSYGIFVKGLTIYTVVYGVYAVVLKSKPRSFQKQVINTVIR